MQQRRAACGKNKKNERPHGVQKTFRVVVRLLMQGKGDYCALA